MTQAAVLDQDYLMANYHQPGFSYLLPEILTLFRRQAAIYLQSIEQYLEKGDMQVLAMEAHTLKGAAGSVGAAALAEIAEYLEETAPASDIAEVRQQVGLLREVTGRTDAAIAVELARLAAEADDELGLP